MSLDNYKFLISVIIPVYNANKYLDRCFSGLINQSLDSIEFIFIDDASIDGSYEKIIDLISLHPNKKFKIHRHTTNLGSASARNSGLKLAEGEYIGWLDADDYIEFDMFQSLYPFGGIVKHDMTWCDFDLVFSDRSERKPQNFPTDIREYLNKLLSGEIQGMLWNKLMKHDIIKKHDLKFLAGENMGEDRAFLFKFLFFSKTIHHVPENKYYYVQTSPGALTRDPKVERIYEEINNNKDILNFIFENNIHWISDSTINNFKLWSKHKLLFSTRIIDFKNWKSIFPDVNWKIMKSNIGFRHKFLGIASTIGIWPLIKFWIFLKTSFK
ncbi:glycosyltransferase family 2 protein [Sphingobacterium kyonggiense]|uniref:Glycosyltransferase family 2 protein n=1 Tax=Sphingobacterium kyonggiense TaxID=714075 RepID=A0ABP7YWH8_9SPHI